MIDSVYTGIAAGLVISVVLMVVIIALGANWQTAGLIASLVGMIGGGLVGAIALDTAKRK